MQTGTSFNAYDKSLCCLANTEKGEGTYES